MRCTQKRLLREWKKEEKERERVCHNCRRKSNTGKGFGGSGGHVNNIHHFRDGRKTKRNHHRDLPSHSSSDSSYCHHDCVDDYENDFEDFTVMNRLRTLGFNGTSAHQISRTRRKYMCNTCSEVLPTFHAVVCHVKEDDEKHEKEKAKFSSSAVAGAKVDDEKEEGEITAEEEADVMQDDEKEEGELSAEEEEAIVKEDDKVADVEDGVGAKATTEDAEKCESGGTMNEEVSTSDPPKRLDFDLNELPPPED